MANGDKMVTDAKCEGLHFSLQGIELKNDLRILDIQGYDIILGIDWLAQFRPMQIDWLEKWISLNFKKNGKTIKLQMKPEVAQIQVCQTVNLEKEVREGSELVLASVDHSHPSFINEIVPVENTHIIRASTLAASCNAPFISLP